VPKQGSIVLKPVSKKELEHSGAPPESVTDVLEQLVDKLESSKAEMLTDPEFLSGLLRQTVDGSSFPTEGNSGVGEKIRKHNLAGRHKKVKAYLFLSETEYSQLDAYRKQRGDRSISDLVNELLCRALAALRTL
tara:strand:- start:491 stop:892 length:402 start_codon:yes stop_codon:yes gene_type:complete